MKILVYKKDLINIRMHSTIKTLQCGSLWCECEVTQKEFEVIQNYGYWFELISQ
jgi:hypothetical protein